MAFKIGDKVRVCDEPYIREEMRGATGEVIGCKEQFGSQFYLCRFKAVEYWFAESELELVEEGA